MSTARRGSLATHTRGPVAAPGARRWRGGNIICKPTQSTGWTDFWGGQYDLSWITGQIDRGITLGLNVFRIIGAVNGIVAGTYSRATYLARQAAVHEYCCNRNVWYYPCGAGDYSTTLNSATQDELVAHATALVGAPNILGFDILQEFDLVAGSKAISVATIATTLSGWSAAINAANPALRRSCSGASQSSAVHTAVSAFVDFYDFHSYLNQAHTFSLTDKTHIIGEFGASVDKSATVRQHIYEFSKTWALNTPLCEGVLCWGLADQESPPASNAYGVFDNSGVERTDMGNVMRAIPKTR